jgi:hypothetical protein
MNLTIILGKFSTLNNAQYADIAKFWEIVEKYCHCDELMGFGTNWIDNTFDYGIIIKDKNVNITGILLELNDTFHNMYVDTNYTIPDKYDMVYTGYTNDLQNAYEHLWRIGRIEYELERFTDDGKCEIRVIYDRSDYR